MNQPVAACSPRSLSAPQAAPRSAALDRAVVGTAAAPDPCAASQVAKTVGTVATTPGAYLDAHPQTNQALTTISQQQGGPQSLVALKTYFDANPQVAKDLQRLQQPLTDLSGRVQAAGDRSAAAWSDAGRTAGRCVPGGLPGSLPGAQSVGMPGAALPAQSSPASAVVGGTGPLPGPATVSTR